MNSSSTSERRQTRAVVLAAGRGWRMRPLSDETHKALLTIGGKSVLERIVASLLEVDVTEIVIVTGYRAESVREILIDAFPDAPIRFLHNERWETTNNIVSLSQAFDGLEFDRDVLLIECDLVFDPRILTAVLDLPGNVALVSPYGPGMDGTVVTVEDSLITAVHPPHAQGSSFDYGSALKTLNIYKFDRTFCAEVFQNLLRYYATAVDDNCYYELVLGMLISMGHDTVRAVVVDRDRWSEIDDPNDLEVARFTFEPEKRFDRIGRDHGGYWNHNLLDFGHPSNSAFPPPAMLAALRHALPDLLANYGSTQEVLDRKLAYVLKCSPKRLRCLNGASQAFPLLSEWWRNRPALLPRPTFLEWPAAFPEHEVYEDRPGFDLAAITQRAASDSVLVIVNPNNPTGTVVSTPKILHFAETRPDVEIVLDESFIAFSLQPPAVEFLEQNPLPNVTVLTSLGKAYGIPGLRLGALYSGDPKLHRWVGEKLPIWNTNAIAEFFLETVLKYRTEFEQSLRHTGHQRTELALRLAQLPLFDRVYPSEAAFLLVRLAEPDPEAGKRLARSVLADDRIVLKDVSDRFPDDRAYLRLTVRTEDENHHLIDLLNRRTPSGDPR